MTKKELLEIIKRAAREKATVLYLVGNQLTSIPVELGRLTNLTWLWLAHPLSHRYASGLHREIFILFQQL